MTIQEFAQVANTYYLIGNNLDKAEEAMYNVLKDAYNELSQADKDLVNTLCDARLIDIL